MSCGSATGKRVFHTSPAFLVRSSDMGEADRRLTFFTRGAGVVSCVAKSAWRSRKRFGGLLQRYVLLNITWTEIQGKMPVLDSASFLESFWPIVEEWDRVRHADYLLELATEIFPQGGPKPKAFNMLLEGMRSLSAGESPKKAARRTETGFLSIGGWGPDLSGCRKCREMKGMWYRFLPSEGGVLCESCATGAGARISLGAVKTWKALQAHGEPASARLQVPDGIAVELQAVIPKYIEYCLGKTLHSLQGF